DGVVGATENSSVVIADANAPLRIGQAEGFLTNGLIDEVGIYNRALSTGEIQAIFNRGSAGKSNTLGNLGSGVVIDGASGNAIGGTMAGARNVLSGNGDATHPFAYGVLIAGGGHDNLIQGNYVGVNAAGTDVLGNQRTGVAIVHSPNNTIGGTDVG